MDNLKWDVNRKEGAYSGEVADHGATRGADEQGRMHCGQRTGGGGGAGALVLPPLQAQLHPPSDNIFDHANTPHTPYLSARNGQQQMQSTSFNYW